MTTPRHYFRAATGGYSEAVPGRRTAPPVRRSAIPAGSRFHPSEAVARAACGDLSADTVAFLDTLLWVVDNPDEKRRPFRDAIPGDVHPELAAAVEGFCDAFREYLAEKHPDLDPDAGERSFGGDVFFTLSAHGCGFWDDSDSEWGDAMSEALYAFAGDRYRFEGLESDLYRFAGGIHLARRSAAFRREALAKLFTPATPIS